MGINTGQHPNDLVISRLVPRIDVKIPERYISGEILGGGQRGIYVAIILPPFCRWNSCAFKNILSLYFMPRSKQICVIGIIVMAFFCPQLILYP